ncbi:MAG: phycobilisome linker polypeptide [Cyanobacteria bacterium J06598_4]
MSGMITTGANNVSTYGSRTIAINVTGVCRQDVMRTSNYTVKVPYSRMSQTIQTINRMGGKVAGISLGSTVTPEVATAAPPAPEPETTAPKQSKGRGRKNRNR